jgi:hypothetical protein
VTRTPALATLLLSAWLSGLVVATGPLGFESPVALRHPSAALPRFAPPARFCEPRFALEVCELREDLSPEESAEFGALVREHGGAVARWRDERRPAVATADWWRGAWPVFALLWTALATVLGRRALRAVARLSPGGAGS